MVTADDAEEMLEKSLQSAVDHRWTTSCSYIERFAPWILAGLSW
jgi:hypothetical protein